MSTINQHDRPSLSPSVQAVLGQLRRRIRQYIWLEGCAAAVAWSGVAFWATLAADWFFEPSVAVRAIMLALVFVVFAAILLQLIGRRAFVRITDSNAAMLLERRFPQLGDSLLTAVALCSRHTPRADTAEGLTGSVQGGQTFLSARKGQARMPVLLTPEFDPEMLARTCREAAAHIADVDLKRVFQPATAMAEAAGRRIVDAERGVVCRGVFRRVRRVGASHAGALRRALASQHQAGGRGISGRRAKSCPRRRLGGRGPGRRHDAAGAASGRSPLSDRGRRPGPRHDGPARRCPRAERQVPGICLHLPQRAGRRPLRRGRRRRPRRRPVDPSGR